MVRIADPSEIILEIGLSSAITEEQRAVVETSLTKAEGAIRRHLGYDPVQAARTEYYPNMDVDAANQAFQWDANDSTAFQARISSAIFDELQLRHIPLRASTAPRVFIDTDGRFGSKSGAFAAGTERTIGDDWWPQYDGNDDASSAICRDGILRSHGLWPTTPGSVKVIYTAGYTSDELHGKDALVDASPIFDAVVDETVRRVIKAFNRRKSSAGFMAGPLTSEKLGDYSYTLSGAGTAILSGGEYDLMPETQEKLAAFINMGWMIAS